MFICCALGGLRGDYYLTSSYSQKIENCTRRRLKCLQKIPCGEGKEVHTKRTDLPLNLVLELFLESRVRSRGVVLVVEGGH